MLALLVMRSGVKSAAASASSRQVSEFLADGVVVRVEPRGVVLDVEALQPAEEIALGIP